MFCGTDINPRNIPHNWIGYGGRISKIFHEILSIPHNNVMDLDNVMCKIQEQYYNILKEGAY